LDVWPTVMQAFDVPPGSPLGLSLLEPARLPAQRCVPQTFMPMRENLRAYACSDGRYRLLWSVADANPKLYDVREDPFEAKDLAKRDSDRVRRMLDEFNAFMDASRRGSHVTASQLEMTPEHMEQLKKLGYAERNE
jgi:hypothetical protein